MRAINRFRRFRPDSVMDTEELRRISTPTLFVWGAQDPYLPPERARSWIERMPSARPHVVTGGHAPWLEDPAGCARVIARHLAATGYPPEGGAASPSDADAA